ASLISPRHFTRAGSMDHQHNPPRPQELGLSLSLVPSTGVVDPVCGMTVEPASAPASVVHQGKKYYFCCPHCADKFQADPNRYLHPESRPEPVQTLPTAPPGTKVEYICPMHPEI